MCKGHGARCTVHGNHTVETTAPQYLPGYCLYTRTITAFELKFPVRRAALLKKIKNGLSLPAKASFIQSHNIPLWFLIGALVIDIVGMWLLKKIQHSASMALFFGLQVERRGQKTGEVGCSSSHYHLRSAQFCQGGQWISALARIAMAITSCPTASAIIFSSHALRYPSVLALDFCHLT